MRNFSGHRLDLEMLDPVSAAFDVDEDGDQEGLSSGLERADGVFHVVFAGRVGDAERTGRIGLEETLDDLPGLALAAVVGRGSDADVEIVRKPRRQTLAFTLRDVFGDRDEDVIFSVLGP